MPSNDTRKLIQIFDTRSQLESLLDEGQMGVASDTRELITLIPGTAPKEFIRFGQGGSAHTHSWADITNKPTTLAGYGITDGVNASRFLGVGAGLAGGGNLAADRTFSLAGNALAIHNLANASGWLKNNGAGVFSYSVPNYTDVGAAAASHNHPASQITAGTFGAGDFVFQNKVSINNGTLQIFNDGSGYSKLQESSYPFVIQSPQQIYFNPYGNTRLTMHSTGVSITGTTTIDSSITGMLKAVSGLISSAAAGVDYAAATHTHSWADITSGKPTTLAGYGITDGVNSSRFLGVGAGLAGGGNLAADRTFSLAGNALAIHNLANANGWLKNNGAGVFSYSVPNYTDVGAAAASHTHAASQITSGIFGNGSGTLIINSTYSNDLQDGDSGLSIRQVNSSGNYSAFMTFHRAGQHAEHFGLDTTNKFYHGGWSRVNKYYFFTEYNKPNASNITAGTFGSGDYVFPAGLSISGAGKDQTTENPVSSTYSLLVVSNGNLTGSGGMLSIGSSVGTIFASIKGYLIDETSNSKGHLTIATRRNVSDASLTESLRIQADGLVSARAHFEAVGDVKSFSGRVQSYNNNGQGTYLELAKYSGSLPGAGGVGFYYPVLKTDYSQLFFAVNGIYSASIYNGGSYSDFNIPNVAGSNTDISLKSDGQNSFIRTGNFGVGTNNPTSKLEVAGNATITGDLYFGASTNMLSSKSGSWPLIFGINGVEKARFSNTGNFGIGVINPSFKLEANGNAKFADSIRVFNDVNNGSYLELAKYVGCLPGFPAAAPATIKTDGYGIYFAGNGKNIGNIANESTHNAFWLRNNANTEYEVKLSTDNQASYIRYGNFGLGTFLPETKFHVVGGGKFTGGLDIGQDVTVGGLLTVYASLQYDNGIYAAQLNMTTEGEFAATVPIQAPGFKIANSSEVTFNVNDAIEFGDPIEAPWMSVGGYPVVIFYGSYSGAPPVTPWDGFMYYDTNISKLRIYNENSATWHNAA